MAGIDLKDEEFTGLVKEVLVRLARDPRAAHLWQRRPHSGCEDEQKGVSRRNHILTLLKLMGAVAVPGMLTTSCGCGDDPCSGPWDAATDYPTDPPSDTVDSSSETADPVTDTAADTSVDVPDDQPPETCADDPCGCADDPC